MIRQLLPDWARRGYRHMRRMAEHRKNRMQTSEQVFSRIYEQGMWGRSPGGKFCSGTGSSEAHAVEYVKALERYIAKHGIRRVVDLGCGDFAIGQKIAALGVDYTGVDVVPALIRSHSTQYGSSTVRFAHLDIVKNALPDGDLCLIRQVLQHLSNDQIRLILPKLSRYPHVVVTEHYPGPGGRVVPNKDKPHGHDTRVEDDSGVFLEHAPFNARIAEVLLEHETKPLKRSGEVLRTVRVVPA